MKATGIVSRIDDLGKVAIPKAIWQNLGIKEDEPLEIFIDGNGIYLVPYRTEISKILNKTLAQIDIIDCEEGERIREIFKENNLL